MANPLEQLLNRYDQGEIDRRQLLQGLFGTIVGLTVASPAVAGGAVEVKNINHIGISSPQVNRSRDWYEQLLGVKAETIEDNRRVYLRIPGAFISINEAKTASFNHPAYGVTALDGPNPNAKGFVERLTAQGYKATLADAYSVFVTDPDGLLVQLSAPGFTGLEDHPIKK
jgi:catechol 2,3-dioxygenase-like lactoylglutathione lyase family enzyme